ALQRRCPGDHEHSWILGSKKVSQAAGIYPNGLVHAILRAYAKSIHRNTEEIHWVDSKEVIQVDAQKDRNYFGTDFLDHYGTDSFDVDYVTKLPESLEVYAGEDARPGEAARVPQRDGSPEAHGIDASVVDELGWHEIAGIGWANVIETNGELERPGDEHEARRLPWRTSWIRRGDRWQLLEDEVNWRNLHQQPSLERGLRCVCLYRARLDLRADRQFRHFPGMAKVTLQQMLRRAHEGLGHPEQNRFLRILQNSKVSDEVLEEAKKFRCSTCEAYRLPAAARRGAPPKEELFINEHVGVDTVHLRNHRNEAVPSLNVIDFHTHLQLVIPMASESSSEIRKAYRQWIRYFGVPKKVLFDLGTEFRAEFRKQVQNDGSEGLISSLETPTQRGLTERAGGVFKNILYRSMMDYKCSTQEEWLELVDVAIMTRNRLLLRAGYSPIQRVIGYSPRLPGGLLSGGEADHMVAGLIAVGDVDMLRAAKMRKAAAIAFHEADCDQALQSATLSGTRKLSDFEAGQAVFFFRR
ncbi:unnamed protein product, partial [Symbiodinium pilosum]